MRRHRHNLRTDPQLRLSAYLRKYPALELIYRFKQRLCYLLLKKHRTRRQCEVLIPRFLRALHQLRQAGLAPLVQLGQTLSSWSQEIVAMWRFTRNNGITEASTTKWNSSIARPMASVTSKTIDCASRYYVVDRLGN
jgi:transposase